tara:strand:+ start:89 stop:406 length:318 start_codon:yes stop_codon:yes gene_type:complete
MKIKLLTLLLLILFVLILKINDKFIVNPNHDDFGKDFYNTYLKDFGKCKLRTDKENCILEYRKKTKYEPSRLRKSYNPIRFYKRYGVKHLFPHKKPLRIIPNIYF